MDPLFVATLIAMNAVIHIDHRQTLEVARHPYYHEHNPILGPHPTVGKVNAYFAASHLLATGIMFALPRDCAIAYGLVVVAVEVGFIANNRSIGLKVRF